jgi:hypothetical protein
LWGSYKRLVDFYRFGGVYNRSNRLMIM